MRDLVSMSQASSDVVESEKSHESTPVRSATYEKGAIFTLQADQLGNRLLTVRVHRVYRPFSFSCVMTVEILHGLSRTDDIPQRAVLKLYDRRFAHDLRMEHKLDPWTRTHENAYIDFVRSEDAIKFMNSLQQSEYLEEPEAGWNMAESETYLQNWCFDMRAAELEAYQHLRPLQGNQIPKIFSSVATHVQVPSTTQSGNSHHSAKLLQTPGILMEHIVGPTLVQMPDFVHPRQWQVIFDSALDILHIISDRGVINERISAANFVASPQSDDNEGYRVVMIDFAQCTIRQRGQSENDWRSLETAQDAEGHFGRAMATILKRVGFDLRVTSANGAAAS